MSDHASYHFITDRLAVGNLGSRAVPGFCAVVTVMPDKERPGILAVELTERSPQVPAGVPVHLIDIADGEGWHLGADAHRLRTYLDEATAFIAEHIKNGCVLVHCAAGLSRSPSVAAAYLCRYAGMSLNEAVSLIRSRRPHVAPWDGFKREIAEWLRLDELATSGPREGADA